MRGIAVKLTAALGLALGAFTAVATLASCSLGGDAGDGGAGTVETGTASISSGGKTERVSVDSKGRQASGVSSFPAISFDGRYVAFRSTAPNLVPGDTNGVVDAFVHDRRTGRTERVSVDSAGNQANAGSFRAGLSADGRYVTFRSFASNLVAGDTNGVVDAFVHDRRTGMTERVSVGDSGRQANAESVSTTLSGDGRFVAFSTEATNIVPGDANRAMDVFVHDRKTGRTERVTVTSAGNEANGGSHSSGVSANGRYVAFRSFASNLVAGDTNGIGDDFVHDRKTGRTERVNVSSTGAEANGHSFRPAISANGRYVAFRSFASNLVPRDTNGELDVFAHDRKTGVTERVSVDSFGRQVQGVMSRAFISPDGRYVAFASSATTLVPGDTNGEMDVFVHDRRTGATSRVSVDSFGRQANGRSRPSPLSAGARYVSFGSEASVLVAGDTNESIDVFVHAAGAADLVTSVVALVESFDLDAGTRKILESELRQLARVTSKGDRAGACRALARLSSRARTLSGEGLTASQLRELLVSSRQIRGTRELRSCVAP